MFIERKGAKEWWMCSPLRNQHLSLLLINEAVVSIMGMVVVVECPSLLMIEIGSSVTIVVSGGILKTNVGTSMAGHMNPLGWRGGWLGANKFNAHSVTSSPTKIAARTSLPLNSSDGGLSREEIEAFRCFASHLDHPSSASASSFAYSGTSAFVLSIYF